MTDTHAALSDLDDFGIEVPSWAYGNSGTRFKVFSTAGTPRDPWEKIADAAQVHAVTGLAPRVSIHIPWDKVEDYAALQAHAKELGVRSGAVTTGSVRLNQALHALLRERGRFEILTTHRRSMSFVRAMRTQRRGRRRCHRRAGARGG